MLQLLMESLSIQQLIKPSRLSKSLVSDLEALSLMVGFYLFTDEPEVRSWEASCLPPSQTPGARHRSPASILGLLDPCLPSLSPLALLSAPSRPPLMLSLPAHPSVSRATAFASHRRRVPEPRTSWLEQGLGRRCVRGVGRGVAEAEEKRATYLT